MLKLPKTDGSEPDLAADQLADSWLSRQRELLTASLDNIASAVRTALDNAGLGVEVFFTVPSTGNALLMVATPVNPSDPDWPRANQIICDSVGNTIGMKGLYSQCLPCADVPSRGVTDGQTA